MTALVRGQLQAQELSEAFEKIAQREDIRLYTIEPGSPAERVQQAMAVMGGVWQNRRR